VVPLGLLCVIIVTGLLTTAFAAAPPAGKEASPAAKPAAAKPDAAPAAKPDAAAAKPEAAAAKPEAAAAKPEAQSPHVVKPGLLKVTVELDGVFEAQSTGEIVVRLDEWIPPTGLTVASAVKHGANVRKGDVLVTFDTEKLDKTIADLTADLKLADLSLRQAEEQLAALQKTTPMDLEANERLARMTNEDRKQYFETEHPYQLKVVEFNLRSSKNSLEYMQEELRQLEKMYKADDVTEETEEIVLKRARDQVEYGKMMVEGAQMRHDFSVKYGMPRMEERMKDASQRQLLECDRTKIALPVALQKMQLDVEKQTVLRARSQERLKKLQADRERLTVRSPLEGLVYYGKCTRGKITDAGALGDVLRPFGTVQLNQVFMTVVQPASVTIRATIPEDQVHRLRAGVSGFAVPNAFPALRLAATLSRCSDVPVSPSSFDAQLKVVVPKEVKGVMPGMACKLKLVPYLKKDALTIPPKALMTEELDDQPFVYVADKDGKATKRPVTLGQKTDKQVEILSGLAAGEQVLLEAPKEK
jgi:multidrug efflux pump subunit AcrA (membrane-fusion protein)